ncbi:uncharacterized protein (TIGR02246 family) [Granulicella aggregans]|uniref:Uncharacterized protein (TIGR02246 family) n=1 Tax=Granulicella aggregans TaxID=474949 RepID=A0A7W7ZK02_9BACT|nr:nuclear transport factor 2 family protein [Granulicella aggregans]MBB5061182.1 uncharacterized protein (TIGR02246 family) [Granulicella aggregans]
MHGTPYPSELPPQKSATWRKRVSIPAAALVAIVIAHQAAAAQAAATSPDVSAIESKIHAEDSIIGRAIATRDFATVQKYWSPSLVVNGPANKIVNRNQVVESMHNGGLNYTSLKGKTEFFTVTNGVAIDMGHDEVVTADGPMAGKHLVRRSTNIFQRSGDDWVLIARQATYVGFDGAILAGTVTSPFTPPSPAPDDAAIHTQIEANGRAVGNAIATNDFAALEKLWSPAMVVNSPGNNILTRDQVFAAMREDKLKYSSAKAVPEAFYTVRDLAIEMGHDDIVMANGPMAGKPISRRFTNVWQKNGDQWLQIARQATYVGIDGGAVYGHPDPTLDPISLAAPTFPQNTAVTGSPEDIKAIEALVHSNPSDHVTEDVSFTNIFGTVRFGRDEFIQRHKETGQTFFKGATSTSSITKLRFVRPDVAVVDISGELSGFQKVYPGLPVGKDGVLRNKLLLVLIKEDGTWWITEFHNVAQTPEV